MFQSAFCFSDKHHSQKQFESFHLIGYSSSSREAKAGTRGWKKNRGGTLLISPIPLVCSTIFLIQPTFTVPRMWLPTVDRILPHQLVTNKIPHRQGLRGNLIKAILQLKFPLHSYVKMTGKISHHKQFYNHSESEFLQLEFVQLTSLTSELLEDAMRQWRGM